MASGCDFPMKLFDDISRDSTHPRDYSEPKFTFLNRTAIPMFVRVREVLEDWFSRYPSHEQKEFARRFRSIDDLGHRAALFELYLHELLHEMGFHVDIHPKIEGTSEKRPDFLVTDQESKQLYVEAVIASDTSLDEIGELSRANLLKDEINRRLVSEHCFIGLKIINNPKRSPRIKTIVGRLQTLINGMDPIETQTIKVGSEPRWTISDQGWEIDFWPIPKQSNGPSDGGKRNIGVEYFPLQTIEPEIAIGKAILRKANKYGTLNLPFIIAVNAISDDANPLAFEQALFGCEKIVVEKLPGRVFSERFTREPDGVWTSTKGQRYTRVSGVLAVERLESWNLSSAPLRLYRNPWAQFSDVSNLARLPQAVVENNLVKNVEGTEAGTILNLAPDWPRS